MKDENYLAHHGIKGQKWGVRRFQNEDGTLTREGQLRYAKYLKDKEEKKLGSKLFDYDGDPRDWKSNETRNQASKRAHEKFDKGKKEIEQRYKQMFADIKSGKLKLNPDKKEVQNLLKHIDEDTQYKKSVGKTIVAASVVTLGAVSVGVLAKKVGSSIKDLVDFGKSAVEAIRQGII